MTPTTDISSIQVKLLFLHFKSVKINSDIRRIMDVSTDDSLSASIKFKGEIAYDIIDLVALFEGYHTIVGDVFECAQIKPHLTPNLKAALGTVQKKTSQWNHVRNKIGGHVDIGPIQEFCEQYKYRGVFISNDLEADFKGVLILQMIESAINSTVTNSRLFDKKLVLTDPADLTRLIDKLNSDWKSCIDLFGALSTFLYEAGKQEKLNSISSQDIGIIKF